MPKIAELYASLGIQPDRKSFLAAERQLDKFAGKADRRVGGIFKRSRGKRGRSGLFGLNVPGMGHLAGIGAGLVGASAIKDAQNFDQALTSLAVASSGAVGSLDDVRKRILEVSAETGVSKEEILGGAAQFVALTGDGEAASAVMESFAKISKATGATMADLSASAAAMNQNLGIDPSQFEQAFSVLIRSGKSGAVELRDMAGLLAELTPQMMMFRGGSGVEGLNQLSALLQTVRQGAGSASQAATQLESLFGAIRQKATKFKKEGGVSVYTISKDESGRTVKTLRPFLDIIDDIGNSKLATDPELLGKILGRKEATAGLMTILRNRDAVTGLIDASRGATDAADDYARVMKSSSASATKAWNRVKVAAAEAAAPVFELGAYLLEKGVDGFGLLGMIDEIGDINDQIKKDQQEARDLGRSGVSQILMGDEGVDARILRRQLLGDRSTDPLADRGDFNLLDIVGRAAIAANPESVMFGRQQMQERERQVSIDNRTSFLMTINAAADMDEATLATLVAKETRKEMERQARAIDLNGVLPDL